MNRKALGRLLPVVAALCLTLMLGTVCPPAALAEDTPFVGQIDTFPFNFAPRGWMQCDGQVLPISQNTALFSLLGTTYGGDGKSTFALPNLEGSMPIGQGQGPGLSLYDLGETGGEKSVTLIQSEVPAVSGKLPASTSSGNTNTPGPTTSLAQPTSPNRLEVSDTYANSDGASVSNVVVGGGLPHNNLPPYLTLNFCIALQGVFPPRS
jgi:microcystin-dependent protein